MVGQYTMLKSWEQIFTPTIEYIWDHGDFTSWYSFAGPIDLGRDNTFFYVLSNMTSDLDDQLGAHKAPEDLGPTVEYDISRINKLNHSISWISLEGLELVVQKYYEVVPEIKPDLPLEASLAAMRQLGISGLVYWFSY